MALELTELPLCAFCSSEVAYVKVLDTDGLTLVDICDGCLDKVDFEMPDEIPDPNIEGQPEFNGAFNAW